MQKSFFGYRRDNGRVGIRNHVLILPLDDLSQPACDAVANNIGGTVAIQHPYGRLQFGADLDLHFRTLIGAGSNPNVAAVIVIGIEEKWTQDVVDGIAKTGKPVAGFGIEQHGQIDTIGGNISFGAGEQREYDEQYIRRMATIAGADGFIRSMPEGYDTVVGERGVGLSGGQKQRLSLARALADNPSILIMDDTTSAVDMETEAEIQRHLRELDERKTIVTIAHRISSVKDSDLILVLEHGRIVERGTHDELVAAHGRYWEIYYKQLGLQAGRSHGFEA